MSDTIEEALADLRKRFDYFTEEMDKHQYIIDLSKKNKGLAEEDKVEKNEIIGCQSRSWMIAKVDEDGRCTFNTDSEAFIVKGLLTILQRVFDGHTAEEILMISADHILESIGLGSSITSQRQNGFRSAVEKVHQFCREGGWIRTR